MTFTGAGNFDVIFTTHVMNVRRRKNRCIILTSIRQRFRQFSAKIFLPDSDRPHFSLLPQLLEGTRAIRPAKNSRMPAQHQPQGRQAPPVVVQRRPRMTEHQDEQRRGSDGMSDLQYAEGERRWPDHGRDADHS